MKTLKRLFLLLAFLAVVPATLCVAQEKHYYFRSIGVRDGLSQPSITDILQDRTGFLWFASHDGLNRYDGRSFKVYKKENSALGSSYIVSLHEDRSGQIWVGTDKGAFVYNPTTDTFVPFDKPTADGSAIAEHVAQIDSDKSGNIWLSVETRGLFRYNPKTDRLDCLFSSKGGANTEHFYLDETKCWIVRYDDNLYVADKDLSSPPRPFRDNEGREVFRNCNVNEVIKGSHNMLYIASSEGVTKVNLTTGSTEQILNIYARTLLFRTDEELWIGTESGLYIYDLPTGNINHYRSPNLEDSYSLSDNAIYCFCRDRENGMWIGSYFGGINYCPHQLSYFEKIYPKEGREIFGRHVREICESTDGTLWIGTEDKGLFNYNPETDALTPFYHPAIYNNIHGLCLDGDELWVGTSFGGLNRVNLKTREVRHYGKGTAKNTLPANDGFAICHTSIGDILIGTTLGLVKYNRETDDFIPIEELKKNFVFCMKEDSRANIWVATFSDGVYCFNASTRQWQHFTNNPSDQNSLPSCRVVDIYEDSKHHLWFLTYGDGLCEYRYETGKFIRHDITEGFPSNVCYKMLEDSKGNHWTSTNCGLVSFNPETGELHTYTTSNGLLDNCFNLRSGLVSTSGRIYMGNSKGLIAFRPEEFVRNQTSPAVVITGFYLSGVETTVGTPGSPLEQSITCTEKIRLKASQNNFAFRVAVMSYQSPELNKIDYFLEGYDQNWHSVSDHAPLISYSGLPYGKYKLRIRGANSDGEWNEQERVLEVEIMPPFYLSTIAKLIYLFIFIVALVAVFLSSRRRIIMEQRKVKEQLEAEKQRELYAAKIEFFTNLTHEIRTPLTLIKSPLENVLHERSLPADVRDDLETMEQNTNRLLDLVNQLLDFRKTEVHNFRLYSLPCDVAALVRSIAKRFTPLAQSRGIELTIETPDSLMASADKEVLTKILSNLLTNGVKYSKSYLLLNLTAINDRIILTTCNDGAIIPLAKREEIFKPFARYNAGATPAVTGTGIGLALALSLSELHGGTLRMDDDISCNRFILSIPLTAPAAPKPKAEQKEEPESNHQHTILIVEDNMEMQQFVAKQLRGSHNILLAANGCEALEVLGANIVHLVVSDVMMPEMDGIELCQEMKSALQFSHIPIILLTAKTSMQAKIEGMKHGADLYIEKPFSPEYLRTCVATLLQNRDKLRTAYLQQPLVQTGSLAMTKADEAFLEQLRQAVIENMQTPDFNLDQLAVQLSMSRSSLNRKVKGLLDMTPNDYIRIERLKKAAELLKQEGCRINEVCYITGFNTPSYFAKCFQKQFGVLPKDFMKQ